MKKELPAAKQQITRRSVLNRAAMLGGGAAVSAVLPSLVLTATEASAQTATGATGVPVSFSKEFLANKAFQDLALNFSPPNQGMAFNAGPPAGAGAPGPGGPGAGAAGAGGPGAARPKIAETGALVQPNGDVLFRIYAPNAKDVTIKFSQIRTGELVLTKQDDGVYQALLPYSDFNTGPLPTDVYVDGMLFLYPFIPIHWSAGYPHNFIEIPDPGLEFMLIKDVPHGQMIREIYWSKVANAWRRCIVYTPPEYLTSGNKTYPVLYLQHGAGENEIVWGYAGHANLTLDNLLAEGNAVPFIVVMNDGSLTSSGGSRDVPDTTFERSLIQDCIPYIEKRYRVKTDKWNRGIAGLSMGAFQSCDIGFANPEIFGNIGTFTTSMTHGDSPSEQKRPYHTVMKDPENPEKFGKNYKVYWRSTTPREDRVVDFYADDKLCAEAGIDRLPCYHRVLYPQRVTKWNSWRLAFHEFAQLLFR